MRPLALAALAAILCLSAPGARVRKNAGFLHKLNPWRGSGRGRRRTPLRGGVVAHMDLLAEIGTQGRRDGRGEGR